MIALGIALNDARRIDCRLLATGDDGALAGPAERNTGLVVAVRAIGADGRRGVTAMTIAATMNTASVPAASAITRAFDPVSTSASVGPSSDG